jgi:hypothetical protein
MLVEQAHQDKKKYAELKELHAYDFIDSMIEVEKIEGRARFYIFNL